MPTTTAAAAEQLTDRVRSLAQQTRERVAERDAAIAAARRGGATVAALSRASDLDPGTVRRVLARTA